MRIRVISFASGVVFFLGARKRVAVQGSHQAAWAVWAARKHPAGGAMAREEVAWQ